MWPNGPQIDPYWARKHATDLVVEAMHEAEARQCPTSSARRGVATQLRRLAGWLAPLPSPTNFDGVLTPSTKPSN